jgi:hypothetical protein
MLIGSVRRCCRQQQQFKHRKAAYSICRTLIGSVQRYCRQQQQQQFEHCKEAYMHIKVRLHNLIHYKRNRKHHS